MSYQPQPSGFSPVTPPAPAKGARKPVLIVLGVVVLLAGLIGGGALVTKSKSSVEDNAKKLARAPAGCTTTLDFEKTGTFLVYFERKGTIDKLSGDCAATEGDFERTDDDLPNVTLSLVDADDKAVDIQDATGKSYDAGGFKGELINEITIDEAGTYRLEVPAAGSESRPDTDFAIAIGRDPKVDESKLKTAGGGAALAGLVLGALLILLGLRRGKPPTPAVVASGAPVWQPQYAQPGPGIVTPPTAPYVPPSYPTPSAPDLTQPLPPVYGDPTRVMPPVYGDPTQQMPSAPPPSGSPFDPPAPDDRA